MSEGPLPERIPIPGGGWISAVGDGQELDDDADPAIRVVILRPDDPAGPWWDDEGNYLSDDYEELRRWIGISRELVDDVHAWNAETPERHDAERLARHRAGHQALVERLRQEVHAGILVADPEG